MCVDLGVSQDPPAPLASARRGKGVGVSIFGGEGEQSTWGLCEGFARPWRC